MDLRFYVDVYEQTGTTKLGRGPLTAVKSWENISRMDKAGEFSFVVFASDPGVNVLAKKCVVRCYGIESSGPTYIGAGIIDRIETAFEEDGSVSLIVSGDDLMRELTYRTLKFLSLSSGSAAITHAAALTAVSALAPAGWTFTADGSPPTNAIYYQFAGENVLAGLVQISTVCDTHFYMSGDHHITYRSTFVDSALRAIEVPYAPDVTNQNTAYIERVRTSEDTYDLYSRIYPYGEGTGNTALNLTNTTRAAPAGYTLDTVNNYIKADSAESTYGRIERVVQYSDIKVLGAATLADQQAAANTLFDAALASLRIKSTPARYYELSLGYCPNVLTPTQTIRCILRRVADGALVANYDDVLYITEVKNEITQDRSLRTTGLTVATVKRYNDRDTNPIVELIKTSQLR